MDRKTRYETASSELQLYRLYTLVTEDENGAETLYAIYVLGIL